MARRCSVEINSRSRLDSRSCASCQCARALLRRLVRWAQLLEEPNGTIYILTCCYAPQQARSEHSVSTSSM
eukprot:6188870-Pleurochrysis_carterae.AAC.4